MSETELRRLRDAAARRKHFEDAYRASQARLVPDEYLSWLYEAHHIGTHGVTRSDEARVMDGEPQSMAPRYDRRALALFRAEQAFLLEKRVPILRGGLDEIVGEAAA